MLNVTFLYLSTDKNKYLYMKYRVGLSAKNFYRNFYNYLRKNVTVKPIFTITHHKVENF